VPVWTPGRALRAQRQKLGWRRVAIHEHALCLEIPALNTGFSMLLRACPKGNNTTNLESLSMPEQAGKRLRCAHDGNASMLFQVKQALVAGDSINWAGVPYHSSPETTTFVSSTSRISR